MTPSVTHDVTRPSVDDGDVVARVRQDDEVAFGELYDRHAPAVMHLCAARLADRRDAEDALFVTFLEAWRRRRRMEVVQGSARPWVLAVATDVVGSRRGAAMRRHRVALQQHLDRGAA